MTKNYPDGLTLLISAEEIQSRVKEMGKEIARDYVGKHPVLVGTLKGSFIFVADLARAIRIGCEIDFIRIESYGKGRKSSGKVTLIDGFRGDVEDQDVIVVEDIIDSGLSAQFLREELTKHRPNSLKFAALLVKDNPPALDFGADYIGFKIPDKFVVGYGLDFKQQMRDLSGVYIVE